jgi:hypothetical protein
MSGYPELCADGSQRRIFNFTFDHRIRNPFPDSSRSVAYRAIIPDNFKINKIVDFSTFASLVRTGNNRIHVFLRGLMK